MINKFRRYSKITLIGLLLSSCRTDRRGEDIPAPIIVEVPAGDNYVMGDSEAPVRLVVFSDFECPVCGEFYNHIEAIKEEYIESGKVQYILRDFPLPSHSNAFSSAMWASCAGQQGAYWEMYHHLYQNQGQLSPEYYQSAIEQLGLDSVAFVQCLADSAVSDEVRRDMEAGKSIGINSTPTIIIDNEMYKGMPPLEDFKYLLDRAINRKN